MYALTDYDYFLPEDLIAQEPVNTRDRSRLLHLKRTSGEISHHQFSSLTDLLKKGDVLVVNNTEVIPARIFGRKETGGKLEILIINYAAAAKNIKAGGKLEFECLVKASKLPKPGTHIDFGVDLKAKVSAVHERTCTLEFFSEQPFDEVMNNNGVMPLPPYIKREQAADPKWNDKTSYQTVYAKHKGAVAAPTAGLHFTGETLENLKDRGVLIANITLHVGYGTFMPIRCSDIRDHQMHSEHFIVSENTAEMINAAKTDGRRVVAVGTTSVRTLEYIADEKGHIQPCNGSCDIFIYPGYTFNCVDAMITNFHLPQSTLIMLVSAFAGRENILNAYNCAVKEKYRFFSYGDAMFIE
ncbi:MAG: tRNA preQ1(34) S-adenosylmethionine ribosyltransferase-isomerase QueA [Desulfobacteraceae bacterium]|nr:tRNA preQ1(34) S-adenosylmethionine ribosyltransferase-isomerase QueA [Desulfobacteraceae bacterium]MBC2755611.1 tRNA preQ1(34) S-adenosylmethionine ribosyltransferase-isomerase QueA [Desulfobacteraceae bacterium]